MPQLDVSFLTLDPLLSDTFTVTRRVETFDANGRVVVARQPVVTVRGVVVPLDHVHVERKDDGQVIEHAIEITAKFVFRVVSAGFQPDEISWHGRSYFVDSILGFSAFGTGFQQVRCISVKATDPPQF